MERNLFRQASPSRGLALPSPQTSAAAGYDKSRHRLEVNISHVEGQSSICVQLVDVQALPSNFFFAATQSWKLLAHSNKSDQRQGLYRVSHSLSSGTVSRPSAHMAQRFV